MQVITFRLQIARIHCKLFPFINHPITNPLVSSEFNNHYYAFLQVTGHPRTLRILFIASSCKLPGIVFMTLLQIATRHQRLLLRHCDWNLSFNRIVAVHCFSTSTSTPSHSKVVSSAKEALAKLPSLNGTTIAVGGFGLGRKPETLLDELCNDDSVSDLTIATLTGGVPGHGLGKLIEDGKVKRLISSYYVGENPIFEHAFFSGTIQVELTPQGTLAQRLFSAGAGIPDNPRFYRELKSFTVNGEGWPYIKKFERSQDGQKAYLALKTQDNDLCVDERHRQHAQDSIFGIHVPSDQLTIPFILDGVVAGFDTRVPTQDELDDTSLHVELTSDVEWIPASFAHLLAEEESTADPVNERVSRLQTRRLKVLASKEVKHRIKCCLQTLSDTQSLFEIELANEVNMLNTGDPVLRDDTPNRRTFAIRTGDSTSDVTPENVAKRWMI
ncbi:hypothetical protein MHU86_4679 [Fragilaria crotonensis]|nr:hypothetical protein MHU86_4679 [Fragilaria crotonensis]